MHADRLEYALMVAERDLFKTQEQIAKLREDISDACTGSSSDSCCANVLSVAAGDLQRLVGREDEIIKRIEVLQFLAGKAKE